MRKLIISLAASAVITAGAVAGLQASVKASTDGNRFEARTRPCRTEQGRSVRSSASPTPLTARSHVVSEAGVSGTGTPPPSGRVPIVNSPAANF